jgi:hypothetical protein
LQLSSAVAPFCPTAITVTAARLVVARLRDGGIGYANGEEAFGFKPQKLPLTPQFKSAPLALCAGAPHIIG